MGAPFTIPEPATLDDVRREMEALIGGSNFRPNEPNGLDTPDAIRRDLDALVARHRGAPTCRPTQRVPTGSNYPGNFGSVPKRPEGFRSVDQIGKSDVVPNYLENSGVAAEPDTAAEARRLHLRRQLEAAVEHGAELLSALGLPRLVTGDFIQVDPVAAGDALDQAIAALDALDGDPEAEDGDDAERDTADTEESLGWTSCVSQVRLGHNTHDGDLSALERHGRGFIRSGPDDNEDSDPPERDDEHGSEDGEDIGHHASQFRPRPLTSTARAEVAALARRAARARVAHA